MFKRIFSLVLTVVMLVSYNFNIFSAYGEEQEALLIQIPIVSNEIDDKYLTGYLFNDSECFVSIDDICRLTRSAYEISNDNIIIKQGIMSVILDVRNNTIKLEEQDIECKIKEYEGTYLLKPYSILKLTICLLSVCLKLLFMKQLTLIYIIMFIIILEMKNFQPN